MEHAVTRARGWRGGMHEAIIPEGSRIKAIYKIAIDYGIPTAHQPRYVQVFGKHRSTSDDYRNARPTYGNALLRGLGLGAVGELILLLVGAPTATPALVLVGGLTSDGHESRSRRDSLPCLGGECPSTRLHGGRARGTAALWRGASATDRASSWYGRGGRRGLGVRRGFAVRVQEVGGDGERTGDEKARDGVKWQGGSGGGGARNEGVSPHKANRVFARCKGKKVSAWMGDRGKYVPGAAREHFR